MKNGKYTRKSSGMKVTSVLLAALLLVGCSVGATLAWMTANTAEVKNTFTVGNIQIDLKEHQYVPASNALNDGTNNTSEIKVNENTNYPLTPGKDMPKDPFVTVSTGSEKCWLFVRVDEANNQLPEKPGEPDEDVVFYHFADDWTLVDLSDKGYDAGIQIYCRIVDTDNMGKALYVLSGCDDHANGCVKINTNVTGTFEKTPVLKFTAAAIQYDGLELPTGYDPDPELGGTTFKECASKAFNNLPDAFKSTTNKNTVNPAPDPVI